jgi:hypothetical protein
VEAVRPLPRSPRRRHRRAHPHPGVGEKREGPPRSAPQRSVTSRRRQPSSMRSASSGCATGIVDLDEVVTAVTEAGPPVADAHPNRRAITGLGQCLPQGDVGVKGARATKRVAHDRQVDLHGGRCAAIRSTASRRDVRAGRRCGLRRALQDDGRLRIIHVLVVDLCVDEPPGRHRPRTRPAIVVAGGGPAAAIVVGRRRSIRRA